MILVQGEYSHDPCNRNNAQNRGRNQRLFDEGGNIVTTTGHTHGNCRSRHGGHKRAEAGRLNQDNDPHRVCPHGFTSQNSDGDKNDHNRTIHHDLCQQERNNKEHKANQIGIAEGVGKVRQNITNDLSCTGFRQGSAHCKRTYQQECHGPIDCFNRLTLFQHAEQNHSHGASQADNPSVYTELALENQSQGGQNENDITCTLLERWQRLLVIFSGTFISLVCTTGASGANFVAKKMQ